MFKVRFSAFDLILVALVTAFLKPAVYVLNYLLGGN